ncbi:hypothetical protein CDD83_4602 [Cordyceps sp. RAO-2017]|nr:hypothetical protein CDD83_4602 [Cordyceps sp. RAO-2017]
MEELSEQLDRAMSVSEGASSTKPALPPALAAQAGKTVDEVWAELNKSPLFMTELEEDNDDLAALQALSYEGSPLENAADFKERGNECFRVKGFVDARDGPCSRRSTSTAPPASWAWRTTAAAGSTARPRCG